MTTRDALDALMVAHDALLEDKDHHAATSDAPLWARSDRLLPGARTWTHKTVKEILADIRSAMKEHFGPTVDLSDSTMLGSILSIQAEQLAKLWELAVDTTLT